MTAPIIEARALCKDFAARGGRTVRAVNDVSFAVAPGEQVGLVGESGSGKSTVGRLLLRLVEPTSGGIFHDGRDLCALPPREMRKARADLQIVFQNPHTALHPRMTIARSLAEPLRTLSSLPSPEIRRRVREMFEVIGLPESFAGRYPHELSGGQKQRVCIARALILKPKLIIFDEPTSALDVSVQAQIMDFIMTVRRDMGLSYIFISHNLAVVRYMCSRILVMRNGEIVEVGETEQILTQPAHPYTQNLVASTLEPESSP